MHTADLETSWFEVEHQGRACGIDEIMPGMDRRDRFGIVVHEPLGAVGASLLIQAATAELFRVRRLAGLQDGYPEIYAFHVGRDFGDLSAYDFWPSYKEVVVRAHPTEVMQAIVSRGITRLAMPSGPRCKVEFLWPELMEFEANIRTVIEYAPTGDTPGNDIVIRTYEPAAEGSTTYTLDIHAKTLQFSNDESPDVRRWVGTVGSRLSVLSPVDLERARERHGARIIDGCTTETFRTADVAFALDRLVPQ